jgi:hypothetical protein
LALRSDFTDENSRKLSLPTLRRCGKRRESSGAQDWLDDSDSTASFALMGVGRDGWLDFIEARNVSDENG